MPGLEDLYREIILDHYRNPRNRGELPDAARRTAPRASTRCAATRSSCTSTSTTASSTDMRIGGQGCSISQTLGVDDVARRSRARPSTRPATLVRAFKAMMSIHEHALDGDDATRTRTLVDVKLGDLEALRGVVKFPVRIKCATLAWNTLTQGLEELSA